MKDAPRVDGPAAAMGDGAFRWKRDPSRDARALLEALRAEPGVLDAVVTEEHALVTFDPSRPPPHEPWRFEAALPRGGPFAAREHMVRAVYDGPDLGDVAAWAKTTRDEVIALHSRATYVVRCLGFLPGFAYLGPLDPRLVLPRRSPPRARVEKNMVGLAAGYTGVYPVASPGGWNLIARAIDFAAFDVSTGARLALGDRVRFTPVER